MLLLSLIVQLLDVRISCISVQNDINSPVKDLVALNAKVIENKNLINKI